MMPPHSFRPGPIVVMGVSGSGKSVIGAAMARLLDVPFIEGDGLHPAANVRKMEQGIPLTDEDRWPWLDRVGRELKARAEEGSGAVATCSALRRAYRDRLRTEIGPELRFVFLQGDPALLGKRMQRRKGHFMPVSLLDSQFATLEAPVGEPDVFTVSVDGSPEQVTTAAIKALAAPTGPRSLADD